jgi:hypothetical protein
MHLGKPVGKCTLGRLRRRQENNLKVGHLKVIFVGMGSE